MSVIFPSNFSTSALYNFTPFLNMFSQMALGGGVVEHSLYNRDPKDQALASGIFKVASIALLTLASYSIYYLLPRRPKKELWVAEKDPRQQIKPALNQEESPLPTPIHYNAFNLYGSHVKVAFAARENAYDFLKSIGAKNFNFSLAHGTLPAWSEVDCDQLMDDQIYSWGHFSLTGAELKKQAASLRVSYDPSVVSRSQLQQILTQSAKTYEQEAQARGRMVSSLVTAVYNSLGSPLQRLEKLSLYRMYTTNAPNLAYNKYDRSMFLKPNLSLNEEKYTQEIERILFHFFEEAKLNQDQVVILPGFGQGAFMPSELQPLALKCFRRAISNAVQTFYQDFSVIQFADPNTSLTDTLENIDHLTLSNKSCLDEAHVAAQSGAKVALFNPGDGSGIPGQYFLDGHIALEEMMGLFTTLVLSQHPCCNSKVGDSSLYVERASKH